MTELSWFEDYGNDNYNGYDMSLLRMDEAYLTPIIQDQTNKYRIFSKHKECLQCPYTQLNELDDSLLINNGTFKLENVPHYLYRITTQKVNILKPSDDYFCHIDEDFGEFGIYQLKINYDNCTVGVIKKPVSIAFPILTVFLLYCAIILCAFALAFLYKRFLSGKEKTESSKEKTTKKRVESLDTFRGISIAVMIFVNYGSGGYEILDHSIWNGLHLADLVFPWFMWIMGVCIPISLLSSFKRQETNASIFFSVLKRSIKLFLLGIFLGGGNDLECLRIFGVLQRFGISYFVVTMICLFLMERDFTESNGKFRKHFSDLLKLYCGWIVVGAILLMHTVFFFLVSDEGCPRGYLGPGGLHENSKYYNCTGGATGYVDKIILGDHMYQYPTIQDVYQSQAFDPEGILGCLTSIVHVFIGVQAGVTLLVYKEHSSRLIRWLSWAIVTGVIGGGLCGFSKEDGVIPVNKNLWSLSFVMVTCCFAFVLLSACYVLIDIKRWWSGKPFLFAGMNAILMYIGHEMTYGNFPVRWRVDCGEEHRTHFIALFENLWGTGFWILVSYYLFKIKYFFTI